MVINIILTVLLLTCIINIPLLMTFLFVTFSPTASIASIKQHQQYHSPETTSAIKHSITIHFIIYTHVFPTFTCQKSLLCWCINVKIYAPSELLVRWLNSFRNPSTLHCRDLTVRLHTANGHLCRREKEPGFELLPAGLFLSLFM